MEEVNCTEAVSVATWSRTPGLLKTQTVSTLLLLRAHPGTPPGAGHKAILQIILHFYIGIYKGYQIMVLEDRCPIYYSCPAHC